VCGETESMYVMCGVKWERKLLSAYEYVSQIILKNNGSYNT